MKKQSPLKIITLDIETSPRVGLFFGQIYKASIAKPIQEMYVFGFSWKPLGKKVQSCYIWDFPLYKKDPTNDIEVVKKWRELVSQADIVIGQNSRSFDDKLMMGRVIIHDLPPPLPFQTIDTKSELKQVARYDANGLDWVSKQYGHGGKTDTGGIDLWWECMDIPGFKKGNPKAQRKMVKYCENDVEKTEKKYMRERAFYKRHPHLNAMTGRPESCDRCLGNRIHANFKYTSTKTGLTRAYYTCADCKKSHIRGEVINKSDARMKYV